VASGEVAIAYPQNGGFVSAVVTPTVVAPPPPADPTAPLPPPDPNAGIPGIVQIRGNAKGGNWLSYKIFVGPGYEPAPEQWLQIGPDHPNQVDNNVLENLDLRAFQPGVYSLRLQRIEIDGRVTESIIQFTLDNTPPQVALTQPRAGEYFETPESEWVDVTANINDDSSISKVEFYAGDVLFETKTTAPFTVKWTIGRSGGAPAFKAVVYDAAGNKAESQVIPVRIGAKTQ
jgi:hypothetical protein